MSNALLKVSIKFNLRKPGDTQPTAINAVVRFNNERIVVSGIDKIHPNEWRFAPPAGSLVKRNVLYNFPKTNTKNSVIISRLKKAEAIIDSTFHEFTGKLDETRRYPESKEEIKAFQELCKARVFGFPDPEAAPKITAKVELSNSLIEYVGKLTDDIKHNRRKKPGGKDYARDSYKSFQNLFTKLQAFKERKELTDIRFNDVDLDFYSDFREFVVEETNCSPNYFGALIKNLKTSMEDARELGYHTNEKYKSKHFRKETTETDSIYLNEKQLNVLFNLDLPSDYLSNARDLLLIGSYTGLRYSDYSAITKANIEGSYLKVKTKKTGKRVTIPIQEKGNLRVILDRLDTIHSISNQKLNNYLKEIGQIAAGISAGKAAGFDKLVTVTSYVKGKAVQTKEPFYALLSSHTARRSFATNMFKIGIPSIVIMAVTGHRSEASFLNYIKADDATKAEIMMDLLNRAAV